MRPRNRRNTEPVAPPHLAGQAARKRCLVILQIAVATLLALSAGTVAAIAAGEPQPVESLNSGPGAGATFLRMFGALVFVIALFFLGVWFFKNWTRVLAKSGKAGRLQIIEGRSLGNRQALYVIGYDRQRWLIGASQTGIALVSVLPEAPENAAQGAPAPPPFMSLLHQMLNRKP